MSTPGWKVSDMLLGKTIEQLLMAPERMNQLGQSENYVLLWICLVVKVKPTAVKNRRIQERSEGERRLQSICLTKFPESFSLASILDEWCMPPGRTLSWSHWPETAQKLKPFISDWDLNPCAGTHTQPKSMVSGPNEAQVLDVSSQKEFSERQSDRWEVGLFRIREKHPP